MSWKRNILVLALVFGGGLVSAGGIAAAQSSSTSYKVNEYSFGIGGELNACSASYCSKQAAGETAVGNTSSSSYQAQAGFNTTDQPMLEVAVNGDIDFGILSQTTTASGSANVQVRTYLASGYNMIISGSSPTYSTASLDPMSAGGPSQTSVEQFGINMRNNSDPDVGSEPVQIPDSSFSYGLPTADYNTPDEFKYNDGDIIAYSDSSSGQTNYTLSMIANMSNVTAAGNYVANLSIVVVSTF